LTPDVGAVDFGAFEPCDGALRTVVVANHSVSTVTGLTVSTIGAVDVVSRCGASLAVDASCEIDVIAAPSAEGVFTGSVRLSADAVADTDILVSGEAHTSGLPAIQVGGGKPFDFGRVVIGAAGTTVDIPATNVGTGCLVLGGCAIAGADGLSVTQCPSGTLRAGEEKTLQLSCASTAAATLTGTLTVQPRFAGEAGDLSLRCEVVDDLAVTPIPDAIDFATVDPCNGAQQTIELHNTGASPVTIDGASVASGPLQIVSDTCQGSLAAGASCTVVVGTGSLASEGQFTGNITVRLTEPATTLGIPVQGQATVTAPGVLQVAGGAAVDFGEHPLGVPVERAIALRNEGTDGCLMIASCDAIDDAGVFEIVSCPLGPLAAGSEIEARLRCRPASAGTVLGDFVVTSNSEPAPEPTVLVCSGSASATFRNGFESPLAPSLIVD
jgi:hypothetical protein